MAIKMNKGATFLEVIIYTATFSIILIGVANAALAVYKTRIFVFDQEGASSASRQSLNKMIKDIREASFADNGAYPVELMEDYQMVFYSDIDNDLKVEKVRYFLDGDVLKRGVVESSGTPAVYSGVEEIETISNYIQNIYFSVPMFNYFDKSGTAIDDLSKVLDLGYVELKLISDINTQRTPEYYEFSSTATLRNLINSYAQ